MNVLTDTRLTGHWLNRIEIRMAHMIIKVNKLFIRYPSQVHKSLAEKIERQHNRHTAGDASALVVIKLTEEERKLMCEYNGKYCEILASKMFSVEDKQGVVDPDLLEAYKLATAVNRLFSSYK